MAYIDTKTLANGEVRHRVQWRDGGTRDGARRTETFADRARAQRFADLVDAAGKRMPTPDQLAAFGLDELIPAAPATVTLVDYCGTYIDALTKPKARQIADYRKYVLRTVAPFFGSMALVDVNRAHCREWQRWAEREGGRNGRALAASSVAKVRAAVLYPTFAKACARQDDGSAGIRDWNPFDDLDAPQIIRNPVEILWTPEDARLLILGAYQVDMFTGDAVTMLLGTAMRWGEVFGLTRPAVVLPRRLCTVRRVAADVAGDGRYVLRDEPKSDSGWRRIDYGPALAPVVERRHAAATGPDQLLFGSDAGTVMSHPNFRKRYVRAVTHATALGLDADVTPHGLRHSTITLLGEDPAVTAKALQAFSGHEHESTTARYKHNRGAGAAQITAALDGFLAGVLKGTPATG
jgi:integrase